MCPLRSATAWLRCVFLAIAGLAGPWAAVAHAGPLPRLVLSGAGTLDLASVTRELKAGGVNGAAVILPAVTISTGSASPLTAPTSPLPALAPDVDISAQVQLVFDGSGPGAPSDRDLASRLSTAVSQLGLGNAAIKSLVIRIPGTDTAPDVVQFAVATLAIQARAVRPSIRIELMMPADLFARQADTARRLAAYADSFVFPAAAVVGPGRRAIIDAVGGRAITALAEVTDPSASGMATAYLDVLAANTADIDAIWLQVPSPAAVRPLAQTLAFLAQATVGGFEMSPLERVPVAVSTERGAASGVAFVSGDSPDLRFLIRTAATPGEARTLHIRAATADVQEVTCFDPASGQPLPVSAGSEAPSCGSRSAYVWIAVRRDGEHRLTESVSVRGRAEMRVEEILARWQASREAERRTLLNYTVPALLTLHFESAGFGVNFDVSQQMRRFVAADGTNDWVQDSLLVNGVRLRKGQAFPLPMLEPEKVVSQPLELAMNEKYTYRLLGTDTVGGTLCYVVAIQPASETERLYAGKVWIDGIRFRQVRLQLEQRSASHNVSAHVETQDFRTVTDASGHEFTLLDRIFVQEALNVAGRAVTLEKRYTFDDYEVNAAAFADRIAAARTADAAMYRETDQGLRALRKDGDALVVAADPGKKVKSLIAGTIYDGSVPYPTPLAGISWVDFDYRGTGSQLSAVFAGVFFAGNLSRRVGPNVHASLEVYLSALPLVDKVYNGANEAADRRLRSYDQWVGGVLNWQATPRLTLSASSHLTYTLYKADDTTSPTFVLPGNALTLRAWAEAKYVTRTFDVNALVEPTVRVTGTSPYGTPASPASVSTTPGRYQAELNTRLYAGKLTRGGVSASYYGGWNLDRLTRYHNSFLIKPRIVGLPAGADAFDAVGIASAYYGFNVLDVVKLEGAYNRVWARNRDEASRFRPSDGLSLDLGTAGPFGTYVSAAASFALSGQLERYPSRWGLSLLFYKPMGQ